MAGSVYVSNFGVALTRACSPPVNLVVSNIALRNSPSQPHTGCVRHDRIIC